MMRSVVHLKGTCVSQGTTGQGGGWDGDAADWSAARLKGSIRVRARQRDGDENIYTGKVVVLIF